MRRLVCCVALFVFVLAHSPAATDSGSALRLTGMARAAVQEETVPLPFDTLVSGSILPRQVPACSLSPTQYAIQYPGGGTRIKLEITSTADPTFYLRFGQRVIQVNDRVSAEYQGLFTRGAVYFPVLSVRPFEAGTYYLAVSYCGTQRVDYSIRATLLMQTEADTAGITEETSFGEIPAATPGACALGHTQYKITTPDVGPCGIGVLDRVSALSDQNINLYIRRDQPVAFEDGRIIADQATASPTRTPSIGLPSGGTFYVAVGNCSLATANYFVVLNLLIADPPPGLLINGCEVTRNPNGQFVLTLRGAGMKEGATITVSGLTPRKVKFIELQPGSSDSYSVVRLVKKFCNGLPGTIVMKNPGDCGAATAFFCNQACTD